MEPHRGRREQGHSNLHRNYNLPFVCQIENYETAKGAIVKSSLCIHLKKYLKSVQTVNASFCFHIMETETMCGYIWNFLELWLQDSKLLYNFTETKLKSDYSVTERRDAVTDS